MSRIINGAGNEPLQTMSVVLTCTSRAQRWQAALLLSLSEMISGDWTLPYRQFWSTFGSSRLESAGDTIRYYEIVCDMAIESENGAGML